MTPEFRTFLVELFSAFGPIEIKRLFNFDGLYRGDTIMGIVVDQRVYLKCDAHTRCRYIENGAEAFRFRGRDGGEIVTSYYELPARLYDDGEKASEWAREAFEAAQRSPNAKRKVSKNKKSAARRRSARPDK